MLVHPILRYIVKNSELISEFIFFSILPQCIDPALVPQDPQRSVGTTAFLNPPLFTEYQLACLHFFVSVCVSVFCSSGELADFTAD